MNEQVKFNGVSGIREVAALFMAGAAVSTNQSYNPDQMNYQSQNEWKGR